MGNSVLFNTAGSIALAINYELQGPYNDKFLTKQAAKTIRINAEFFVRVDDAVFCIESDVDLTESDLDTGSNFAASSTYYIYGCHPLDGTNTPQFKISLNATYPAGGWTAANSRKIGGFDTDASGNVNDTTLWDLRTVDVTLTGVEDSQIPANEISLSKLKNGTAGAFLRRDSGGVAVEDAAVALQNLLRNSGVGVWSNGTLQDVASNLITTNADFANWTGDDPDDWTVNNEDGSNYVAQDGANPVAHFVSLTSGGLFFSRSIAGLEIGKLYKLSFEISTYTTGDVRLVMSGAYSQGAKEMGWTSAATHTLVFEATADGNLSLQIYRSLSVNCDYKINSLSLYEVTPGCVAADSLAPDGWAKTSSGVTLYREHGGKNNSQYALRVVVAAATKWIKQYINSNTAPYAPIVNTKGRTVVFGVWVKTAVANHARLALYDATGTYSYGNYHTGGGDWEWLEISKTMSGSDELRFAALMTYQASGDIYLSSPILAFGTFIGEGNYAAQPGEIVWFESPVTLTDYSDVIISADAAINLESQSDGKVPKGAKAVYAVLCGKCATTDKILRLTEGASGDLHGVRLYSPAANIYVSGAGWQQCDENGDIAIRRDDTFNNVTIEILGVQL